MPIDIHPARRVKGRSPEEVNESQQEQARKLKATKAAAAAANVPAVAQTTAPAPLTNDTRTPAEIYADEICQTSIVGQLVKFDGKIGKYAIVETGEDVTNRQFIAIMDETLAGYVRFNGEGQPPDRIQGQPYKGWLKPKRDTLGDNDPSQWPISPLSGKPEDPWKSQVNIVLVDSTTRAFYTFATVSKTGLAGAGALMQHFSRMLRHGDVDSYPVVRLTPSGYDDKRYGWVNKPTFAILNRTPKAMTASVPDTDIKSAMDDEIPF
jgi:biotin carboxyl carrier protein